MRLGARGRAEPLAERRVGHDAHDAVRERMRVARRGQQPGSAVVDEFEDAPHVGVGSAGLGDLMSSETG